MVIMATIIKGPFHIQYKDKTGNWIRSIGLPDKGRESSYQSLIQSDDNP